MRLHTQRSIDTIDQYERQWKIKTNIDKFQVIPVARHSPPPLTLHNTQVPYTRKGRLLGLTVTSSGMSTHITQRAQQANITLTKLKRFSTCTTRTKLRLYTSIIRPVLEFPPVPLHLASNNQMIKLQRIQNKALRWATNTCYPDTTTTQTLHERHKILPLNVRLHNRARKTWRRLAMLEDPNYTRLNETNQDIETRRDTRRRYTWWKRSLPVQDQDDPPPPLYVLPPPQPRRQQRLQQQQPLHFPRPPDSDDDNPDDLHDDYDYDDFQ